MKDTSFSFSRLIHLFHKDVAENWKRYSLYAGVIFGVFLVFFIWRGYILYQRSLFADLTQDIMVPVALTVFMWVLFIGGFVSASSTMDNMKVKSNRIAVFTLPASPLEKYLIRWFMNTIVFLLILVVSFKLADYIRVAVFSLMFPSLPVTTVSFKSLFCVSGTDYHMFKDAIRVSNFVIGYFFLQSCFLLGSVIWPKNAFPRTLLAMLAAMMILSTVLWASVKMFAPEELRYGVNINVDTLGTLIYYWILGVGLTLFNWTIGYFRYKETDIL